MDWFLYDNSLLHERVNDQSSHHIESTRKPEGIKVHSFLLNIKIEMWS